MALLMPRASCLQYSYIHASETICLLQLLRSKTVFDTSRQLVTCKWSWLGETFAVGSIYRKIASILHCDSWSQGSSSSGSRCSSQGCSDSYSQWKHLKGMLPSSSQKETSLWRLRVYFVAVFSSRQFCPCHLSGCCNSIKVLKVSGSILFCLQHCSQTFKIPQMPTAVC